MSDIVLEGHFDGLVGLKRFDLNGEKPVQPKALAPFAALVRVVMHPGGVVDAEAGVWKTSTIALTVECEAVANLFAQNNCTCPRGLLHESRSCDRRREGLRPGEDIDPATGWHEGRQVRCKAGRLCIVASAIEPQIQDDVARPMPGHFI